LSAADALAQSRNVPAMTVLAKVGVDRAVGVMASMGLETLAKEPMQYGLPLAIGGADVTPMELAEAYATLARSGDHRSVAMILASFPDTSPPNHPSLRAESCLAALYCLADRDRTEAVWPPAASLAPAWKTGTSSGHRDAWCAAVTPRRTVVVWLGNADGSSSAALVGQDSAAPLALKILTASDPGGAGFDPPPNFRADAQLASATISSGSISVAMISPVNGQEIIRDPSLPARSQRISLRATGPSGQLWWFVDGECLGKCVTGETLWWAPTAGEHEIRVAADNGRAASAQITVR
jgi:membrane carboxypeptidase/penicillin-binding protein PbpC